ncbi:hypothetical protein RF11_03878 [Thelohanellus kitauei]|uniref:Lipoprotein n=1 Tax=Thelohanellus kitauei TaxID=669202 RepID=A0A0C2MBT6_THEKT|nr:hypothetical protein RF11_03878 [Thelohanellus kitauei]
MLSSRFLCVLLCVFFTLGCSKDSSLFKIIPARNGDIPGITQNEYPDKSDKLEVITNPNRPGFVLYWTKSSTKHVEGSIYKYDPSKSVFVPVVFSVPGEVKSLDRIKPSGDKMFCVSYAKNVSFYIDEHLKVDHVQTIEAIYKYLPNPQHPESIARYKPVPEVNIINIFVSPMSLDEFYYNGYHMLEISKKHE